MGDRSLRTIVVGFSSRSGSTTPPVAKNGRPDLDDAAIIQFGEEADGHAEKLVVGRVPIEDRTSTRP